MNEHVIRRGTLAPEAPRPVGDEQLVRTALALASRHASSRKVSHAQLRARPNALLSPAARCGAGVSAASTDHTAVTRHAPASAQTSARRSECRRLRPASTR